MMEKRLSFLKYILEQEPETIMKQVYNEQKVKHRKGDFVDQIEKDKAELNIKLEDKEIKEMTKSKWKDMIKQKTEEKAFKDLLKENSEKTKTKDIVFESLKLSDYLKENINSTLSNIIFSIRSGTLDTKQWNSWSYENNLCLMCELKEETMDHFMECQSYGTKSEIIKWRDIYKNNTEKQFEIAKEVQKRLKIRNMKKEEAGLDSTLGSTAPTYVEHLEIN